MRQFTIGRLMIVIAVVGLSLSLFLASPSGTRSYLSSRTQCSSNLRNVVLGVLQYANREGVIPTATWPNASLSPEKRLSWYAAILSDLEQSDLWDRLDWSRAWDNDVVPEGGDMSNEQIAFTRIGVARCPDDPSLPAGQFVPTHYIGIAGLGTDAPFLPAGHPRAGVFGHDRLTTLLDIKDGVSQTMMIAESARVRGSWLSGGPATVRGLDTTDLPYIGSGRQIGGVHLGGANVAFADGAVRFVSDTINPRVLEALSTIAGGETLPTNPFP